MARDKPSGAEKEARLELLKKVPTIELSSQTDALNRITKKDKPAHAFIEAEATQSIIEWVDSYKTMCPGCIHYGDGSASDSCDCLSNVDSEEFALEVHQILMFWLGNPGLQSTKIA